MCTLPVAFHIKAMFTSEHFIGDEENPKCAVVSRVLDSLQNSVLDLTFLVKSDFKLEICYNPMEHMIERVTSQ